VGFLEVGATDLDVDGGGQAEVEDGVDESAGLEIGGDLGQFLADALSDPIQCRRR